ncbi:MAG: formate dehydrogenase accessory protein FdhE [Pyrinomonadaceae bacterium]
MASTTDSWDARIERAEELARKVDATRELLTFYAKLLQAQKEVYESLRSRRGWLPSGCLPDDLSVLREYLLAVLRTVESCGPTALAEQASSLMSGSNESVDEMLLTYWETRSDKQFFAKAFLQPYAQWLADSGATPIPHDLARSENRCPFCLGKPQVSFLSITEPGAESGNRNLVCATCLSSWVFRRVVCAFCGEERPFKLGYFHTEEYDHVRIEACDTCKHYIKGVDLTRLGFAVPLVDDVAAAALDVWASEKGYEKIELNLIGL